MRSSTMIYIPAAMLIFAGLLSALGAIPVDLGGVPTILGLALTFVALSVAQREPSG